MLSLDIDLSINLIDYLDNNPTTLVELTEDNMHVEDELDESSDVHIWMFDKSSMK